MKLSPVFVACLLPADTMALSPSDANALAHKQFFSPIPHPQERIRLRFKLSIEYKIDDSLSLLCCGETLLDDLSGKGFSNSQTDEFKRQNRQAWPTRSTAHLALRLRQGPQAGCLWDL